MSGGQLGQAVFTGGQRWRVAGGTSFLGRPVLAFQAALLGIYLIQICEEDQHSGERSLSHVLHLQPASLPRPASVHRLLGLPNQHTESQKQEEAGEENGEEHKKIDMWLVLKEEKVTIGRLIQLITNSKHNNEEAHIIQVVLTTRQSYHQSICDVLNHQ